MCRGGLHIGEEKFEKYLAVDPKTLPREDQLIYKGILQTHGVLEQLQEVKKAERDSGELNDRLTKTRKDILDKVEELAKPEREALEEAETQHGNAQRRRLAVERPLGFFVGRQQLSQAAE